MQTKFVTTRQEEQNFN